MASVRVTHAFPGTVHEAETCWYHTERWPQWVDGLARVVALEGDWPRAGARVVWESGPAGRGRVSERVTAYEPLAGQTLEVSDESIEGRQRVAFTPVDEGVEVALSLEYAIKRRSLLTPVIDTLFVRRLVATSLRKTLARFATELTESRHAGVG